MMIAPGADSFNRAFTGNPVRNQQTEAGAGIALEHEVNGPTGGLRRGRAQRCQNANVEGVIKEQHFGGFYNECHQRQQAGINEPLHHSAGSVADSGHEWSNRQHGDHRHNQAQDTEREVVDQEVQNQSGSSVR